jgi:glutamate-1-semialdehyde 2,1-aminomutase
MKTFTNSEKLFKEAQKYLPGGVDSPVRAFKSVGGTPPFIVKGKGSKITDADGNEYIDYVCSWGPLILGHAPAGVISAIQKIAEQGTSFGAPTELEITLAKMVSKAVPSMEMLRFVSSGTEATMSAIRLARGFTGRDKIIKFAGCYHGHSDGLLAKAGSGLATLGIPDSPGVPASYAQNTLVAPFNDLKAVEGLFKQFPKDIAAIIVEPVAANMGVVAPQPGFMEGLRKVTQDSGALLVFDEVITGFRLALGGAQSVLGIKPDLTCLGKIIGGGLPVGAYGGRRDIMQKMAPIGPVYQAGTLSGNPLAMTAGIETLKALSQPGIYLELERKARALEDGITKAASKASAHVKIVRYASLLTVFFTNRSVTDYDSAKLADTQKFAQFHHVLLRQGIYWPPSQFEAVFLSLAHTDADIDATIAAVQTAFSQI